MSFSPPPKAPRIRARRAIERIVLTITIMTVTLAASIEAIAAEAKSSIQPQFEKQNDPSGIFANYQPAGSTDKTANAFFESLGTNGRQCVTCHEPADGWSITPPHIKQRFASSHGADPLFRPFDGATCPDAGVSTIAARRKAYALLLSKGLIRIGIAPPANAEFTAISISDPYNCQSADLLSLYRRPLPAANLKFSSAIMWDGREPTLETQAINATLIHAETQTPPNPAQLAQIVDFESGMFTAQIQDRKAGLLAAHDGGGTPTSLPQQDFFVGINDPFGNNPTGHPFDPKVFELYSAWPGSRGSAPARARASIARGQEIFNTRPFVITKPFDSGTARYRNLGAAGTHPGPPAFHPAMQ
jgi:cytochrome c peroxidase